MIEKETDERIKGSKEGNMKLKVEVGDSSYSVVCVCVCVCVCVTLCLSLLSPVFSVFHVFQ